MNNSDQLNNGATFIRADLHIHSYDSENGSFDVNDKQMIPKNIVDTAISSGLNVISITDHNEISNVKTAIDYAKGKNILVIPAIEVSTTQGHLLVYFKEYKDLRSFYGKLNITSDKERCTQGIVECLNFAKLYNGFGVLAHIELTSGFEKMMGRFNKAMEDVISHPSLLALEISKKDSYNLYSDKDESTDRRNLALVRQKKLDLEKDNYLPKIMSSDSHSLEKLGRNAEGETKLTRIKLDELSFDAVKIALISHQSRIRIENVIPEKIPRFIEMKLSGGILDKQMVRFNNNLNCIIGGRGTGKSTLLECLRETSGNKSSANVVDSEVWPDDIQLIYEDETGKRIEFKRSKHNSSFNFDDPDNGISHVKIESYGQGETADMIQHSDKDPKELLNFLDSFINITPLSAEDERLCDFRHC